MRSRFAIALFASLSMAGAAAAQDSSPPARIGNVYNGTAHEPDPGVVHSQEKAAGVALPPGAVKQDNKAVEQLDKNIQNNGAASVGPAKSLACSTVPATCR